MLYPAVALVRASLSHYSVTGLYRGSVGASNYARLLEQEALPTVVANTVIWVVVVVLVTVVVSLGLAQLLNEAFPGRRLVRWALIVPWAASVIMTAKLFAWIYDYYFGILNHVLVSLRLVPAPVDWLGNDATVMGAMIAVGVFVSLPFTTYVVLAGLSAIPGEVYEAALGGRRLGLAHVLVRHGAPAAPGPAGGGRAERDLRLQLVPDRVDPERP